ncbi:Uncharacterised protein g1865 [Pycnogonum litorale]
MPYLESLTDDLGKWQYVLLVVCGISVISLGANNIAMPFFAPVQDYWCRIPDSVSRFVNNDTYLNDQSCEIAYTKDDVIDEPNSANGTGTKSVYKCEEWNYDHSVWERTIVEEWNLVCDRDVLISTSSFVYMGGMFIGVLIFAQISDRYGRRIPATIIHFSWMISCLAAAFSVDYVMFTVARFFVAAFAIGGSNTVYIWCMESMNSKGRSISAGVISVTWSVGMLIITGVSFLTKNWVHSQIILAVLVGLYFPGLWMTVESPSWLLSVRRFENVVKVLQKVAKMNGKPVVDKSVIMQDFHKETLEESIGNTVRYTILDLFRRPNIRRNTLILFYNWFVVSFVYYALTLNSNTFGSKSIFTTMTIAAVLEAVGYCIAPFFLMKIGRRSPTSACFTFAGVSCFIVAAIPSGDEALDVLKICITLVGRTCISVAYCNMFIYSSEIHPTVVRNIGLGSGTVVANCWSNASSICERTSKILESNSSVDIAWYTSIIRWYSRAFVTGNKKSTATTFNRRFRENVE